MKKKIKNLFKNKRFVMFFALSIILLICLIIIIRIFFPGRGSNYGNRLDGIKKISFTEKDQNKIVNEIKKDEKVSNSKMNIHGKIINVIYNVNKDVSVDDARAIAAASLNNFSDKVKGFYDIEFIITKTDEAGEEVQITKDDGTTSTEIRKQFPIMGYKNSGSDNIVW